MLRSCRLQDRSFSVGACGLKLRLGRFRSMLVRTAVTHAAAPQKEELSHKLQNRNAGLTADQ